MADYNVTSSDGTFTVNVQTGTINNTYDVPFIGQDAINYGDDLVAAQLRQLENFSNTTAPAFGTTRVKGQLWYDSTPVTGRLNIFDGASWDAIPLDIDVVHTSGAESIADVKTFTSAPVFSAAGAPISVNSNTVVANLNSDFLDGLHATAFATSAQGALADTAEQALPSNTSGAGYVLASDGPSNNYTWVSLSVSAGNVQVDTAQLPTGGQIVFVDNAHGNYGTGTQPPLTAAGITYNAATSTLSTTNFSGTTFTGTLAGNASTATTATTATNATNVTISSNTGSGDTTTYPVLVGANSATNQLPMVDGGQLSYNASTGQLNATLFVGNGAGITTLNLSAGSHTGTLATGRGGTGVGSATGTGSNFALEDSPVFLTQISAPLIAGSVVGIEGNNVVQIQTQNHTTSGNTSGAQVKAHDGTLYDIGFNVLPQFNWDTTDTLEAQHCGHLTGHSDGAAHTLTLPTSGVLDFPVGGITTIVNGSATDYTITDTASATLFFIEPGVGGTDTVGGCTIGAGGAATLYRFADDTFYIWGSEITV